MKISKYLFLLLLALSGATFVSAQNKSDTIKVNGVCGECKVRIEKALKVRGIQKANWSIPTKLLAVTYDTSKISMDEIHSLVAGVGHDTELKKASDEVYANLDECCLYREITSEYDMATADTTGMLRGLVYENQQAHRHALAGASIVWLGNSKGVKTNDHGEFILPIADGSGRLVISYSGFTPDTVNVGDMRDIEIQLERKKNLTSVVVTARRRTTYIDNNNPFRIAVISKKELLKAACCNLSESFETNPSVDVTYNDAVTGSKQIQLLGIAGNYTQLTVENLPGPRGIATPLGLNSIAGPWVESMQLIKGTGSVVNGFESIAGQINVELKKPRESERLYLNGYVNSMGKTDVNLNLAHRFSEKWSVGLLLHDDFLYNKTDMNMDGYRDLPTGNQFAAINRWQYLGDNGLMSQFGVKFMTDSKTGGDVDFNPDTDKYSMHHYGLGIESDRYEAFGKIGYVFPEKMYRSVGFEISAFRHLQDAYFGIKTYNAAQDNLYANLIYQSQLGSEKHQIKGGLSLVHDRYDEDYFTFSFNRTETVPGVFSEYTYKPSGKLDIVAGMRVDHNSLFGWFATPRINVRYEPFSGTTVRLSAGKGQRTANIFAENMGTLVSSREVVIDNNGETGKAYGLNPEVAWNKGISIDQRFKLFSRPATIGLDFYRNDFIDQVVVDIEDPRKVQFYELDGKSYSNSFQVELDVTPLQKFDVRLAYRLFDVKTTFGNELKEKPFTARHRGFLNLAYDLSGWKFDYTLNIVGSKRIPSTMSNPPQYQMDGRSPSYITMNGQLSKSLGKKKLFDWYVGGENLTNYFQDHAIIAAHDPFGPWFDASMIWGPVGGRLVYTGFRYTIK